MRIALIDDREEERNQTMELFSSFAEKTRLTFTVDAFDYVEKPIRPEKFYACLKDCLNQLPEQDEFLSFTVGGLDVRLFYRGIASLRFSGHSTIISVFLLVMALMSFPADIAIAIDCQIHLYEGANTHCLLTNLLQLGFSCLFLLLFGYIFWHFFSKLIDQIRAPRVWLVSLPVPFIFTLLNIVMQPHNYETIYKSRVYQLYLCYLFLAFFLLAVIYVIFYLVAEKLLHSAENEERIRLFEMQKKPVLYPAALYHGNRKAAA